MQSHCQGSLGQRNWMFFLTRRSLASYGDDGGNHCGRCVSDKGPSTSCDPFPFSPPSTLVPYFGREKRNSERGVRCHRMSLMVSTVQRDDSAVKDGKMVPGSLVSRACPDCKYRVAHPISPDWPNEGNGGDWIKLDLLEKPQVLVDVCQSFL